MEKIFTGNGIEIVKHDNSYYLIYDAGEICDRMEKTMKREWVKVIPQIIENFDNKNKIECPNCRECEIDYAYIWRQ